MASVRPCLNIAEHIDLPLSAAVNASARFPYVEDWGWFRPLTDASEKNINDLTNCRAQEGVADGGFFDNYGAVTALDAYNKIKVLSIDARIKPKIVVIQITSDPDCDLTLPLDGSTQRSIECVKILEEKRQLRLRKTGWSALTSEATEYNREQELRDFLYGSAPEDDNPGTYGVAMQARSINGVTAASELRSRVLSNEGDTYYHFSLAGAFESPLGWSLSRYARKRIDDMLLSGTNKGAMDQLAAELNRARR
jgi:hypothetical protein